MSLLPTTLLIFFIHHSQPPPVLHKTYYATSHEPLVDMSSPDAAEKSAGDVPPPQASTTEGDVDLDAEMADTQANTSATANGAASNPDQEMQDSQSAPTAAAQQNRKDATLREFMSKMDDYAPIVRFAPD